MLWIAGGAGVTPFMAMWDGLSQMADTNSANVSSDIVLLFSGRDDDVGILKHFLARKNSLPENLKVQILVYQSVGQDPATANTALDDLRKEAAGTVLSIEQRRVQMSDLKTIHDLGSRDVFLCGPDNLIRWYNNAFETLDVDQSKLHQESFSF